MTDGQKLLGLIASLIVEVALKESLQNAEVPYCSTTLKLSDKTIKAPYGYRLKPVNGKTHIVVYPKEAAIINTIFQDFLNGISIPLIHSKVKQMGFSRTGPYAIHKLLDNCFYAGLERKPIADERSEIWVRTFHPSIIAESTFHAVQKLLHKEKVLKLKHLESMPLRGVLKCACGAKMTAGWHKGKNQHYLYYRCLKHMHAGYSGQVLHKECRQLLKQLNLMNNQIDYVTKDVDKILISTFSEHRKMIEIKLSELKEAYFVLMQGNKWAKEFEITKEVTSNWQEKQKLKIEMIKAELHTLDKSLNAIYTSVFQRIPEMSNMEVLYDKIDYRQKQLLLFGIFNEGLIYSNSKFKIPNMNPTFSADISKRRFTRKPSW